MAVPGYSKLQIRLHWAVVILVALQYLLKDGMVASFRKKVDTGVVDFTGLTVAHIAGGLLILLLALWRLSLRRSVGAPPPPQTDPAWQKLLSKGTHVAIYTCLLMGHTLLLTRSTVKTIDSLIEIYRVGFITARQRSALTKTSTETVYWIPARISMAMAALTQVCRLCFCRPL